MYFVFIESFEYGESGGYSKSFKTKKDLLEYIKNQKEYDEEFYSQYEKEGYLNHMTIVQGKDITKQYISQKEDKIIESKTL